MKQNILLYKFATKLTHWLKGAVCKNHESVQGLHVGLYSTNGFKSPVCEQVVVEVKT